MYRFSPPQAKTSAADLSQASFKDALQSICRGGFSRLGRTRLDKKKSDDNPWQWGSAWPPSYGAMGRYRFLQTLRQAQEIPFSRSLEVAGGSGFLAACLYQPGREIVINDIRDLAEERLAWVNGDHIKFASGDLFKLNPTELGLFDLVIACEVLEHVAHGKSMIAHLISFLKPGGTLLLTTPNGGYFRSKLPTYSAIKDFSVFESRQFQPDADGHLYLYTKTELEDILSSLQMTSIQTKPSITPFISGHAGFRFLPKKSYLFPLYFTLDALVSRLNFSKSSQLCTQLIVTARKPH